MTFRDQEMEIIHWYHLSVILCIFRKLRGVDPMESVSQDQLLLKCIRRVNLDPFWGRESSTVYQTKMYASKVEDPGGAFLLLFVGLSLLPKEADIDVLSLFFVLSLLLTLLILSLLFVESLHGLFMKNSFHLIAFLYLFKPIIKSLKASALLGSETNFSDVSLVILCTSL